MKYSWFGLPWSLSGKETACHCQRCRRWELDPWVRKSPCRRKWQPTPVFLPRKSRGHRNLAAYSPWGCKGSDMTVHGYMHTHIYSWFTMPCYFLIFFFLQQSDLVIHMYVHILFFFNILFHYGLLWDVEDNSLCYTAGPCCLSILYILVIAYIC